MSHPPPPTRRTHQQIYWMIGLFIVLAMIGAVLGYRSQTSAPSAAVSWPLPAVSSPDVPRSEQRAAPGTTAPRQKPDGPVGEADGVVPDGVTVFDEKIPAVARLDPALLKALRRAATDARTDGVTFYVNSGWRSAAYQNQLLREAASKYGSKEAAARWVATPATSQHVKGDAVDIGRSDATTWLARQGAAYGLCQIYRNEPWHYERRPQAIDQGCPPLYADPTQDPRMRQ